MYTKLKYDGFEDYLFEATKEKVLHQYSYQYIFKFDNNYGASVVKNPISHGNKLDLFELEVIKFIDEYNWKICYPKYITDYVIGYLTNDDVLNLLEAIKNL